ncbi:MAG: DUF4232 domain-containing protein [Actinomycetota bacterium]
MRVALLVALPLVLLTAACSGSSSPPAAIPTSPVAVAATPAASGAVTATPSVSQATSPAGSAPTCSTSQLSLRWGKSGAAAGTAYQPIVFTNHASSTCALRGYPGVAFVAPSTGGQVGAAASRNPQQPVATISIKPDSSVSALLGIASYQNFPPGECLSRAVSGVRIYPPGNTAAAYLPFTTASAACSTKVGQLNVAAVVTGSTGQ